MFLFGSETAAAYIGLEVKDAFADLKPRLSPEDLLRSGRVNQLDRG